MKNNIHSEKYVSQLISSLKSKGGFKTGDKFEPVKLQFEKVEFVLPKYFGFCFGVQNAINKAYEIIEENPEKEIYILGEIIHNPTVNRDLAERGVKFIFGDDEKVKQTIIGLNDNSVVVIPAFGTTVEIKNLLSQKNIDIQKFKTTCTFVEKVWKKAEELGNLGASIIIHGKAEHEETKATLSHAEQYSKCLVIRDIKEAKILADFITGKLDKDEFRTIFTGRFSEHFNLENDLNRVGIVNQTTMLSEETIQISNLFRQAYSQKFGEAFVDEHFINTKDTLCYATNNNQRAVENVLFEEADFAIVVGGYNSSNTFHIAKILKKKYDVFFISSAESIKEDNSILHFGLEEKKEIISKDVFKLNQKAKIIITCGASCPDTDIEKVITKILKFYED